MLKEVQAQMNEQAMKEIQAVKEVQALKKKRALKKEQALKEVLTAVMTDSLDWRGLKTAYSSKAWVSQPSTISWLVEKWASFRGRAVEWNLAGTVSYIDMFQINRITMGYNKLLPPVLEGEVQPAQPLPLLLGLVADGQLGRRELGRGAGLVEEVPHLRQVDAAGGVGRGLYGRVDGREAAVPLQPGAVGGGGGGGQTFR